MANWQESLRYEAGWTLINEQWVHLFEIAVVGKRRAILKSGTAIDYGPEDSQQSVAEDIVTWLHSMAEDDPGTVG